MDIYLFAKILFRKIFLLKFRAAKDKFKGFNIFIPIQIRLICFSLIVK